MNKEQFDYITRKLPEDSIKKACYTVREYIREPNTKAVTQEQFNKALTMVLAYAYTKSTDDETIKLYKCESDCYNNCGIGFCPGEFQIDNQPASQLCKHYSIEDK